MQITIGRYKITCYLPDAGKRDRVIYLHTAGGEAEDIWRLSTRDFVMVSIEGLDWNRDLSPWRHAKVFAKGEDFAGGADDYLKVLTGRLIPETESAFLLLPEKRYLAGYSLAGLFAVYALYHTPVFDGIASISGSLWYSGFISYVEEHTIGCSPDMIYFSLGDKEADSARGLMRNVSVCTKRIVEKFRADGIFVVSEKNPGNHFFQVPERTAKGLYRLLQAEEDQKRIRSGEIERR